jgi:hypothetical protein
MAGQLVNRLRPGFLDHMVVRTRILRDNILRPSIEVTDVTALKISESVEFHRIAVLLVRTAVSAWFVEIIRMSNFSWAAKTWKLFGSGSWAAPDLARNVNIWR